MFSVPGKPRQRIVRAVGSDLGQCRKGSAVGGAVEFRSRFDRSIRARARLWRRRRGAPPLLSGPIVPELTAVKFFGMTGQTETWNLYADRTRSPEVPQENCPQGQVPMHAASVTQGR